MLTSCFRVLFVLGAVLLTCRLDAQDRSGAEPVLRSVGDEARPYIEMIVKGQRPPKPVPDIEKLREGGRSSISMLVWMLLDDRIYHAGVRRVLAEIAGDPGATARNRQNLALVYGLAGDVEKAAEIGRLDLDESEVRNNLAYYARLRALPAADRSAAILGRTASE